ncbi:MAG TPA: hypothetical protein VJU15_09750 [Gemmatimonadales bacterium]|nr:hypothetical protein [Gemmatimonadales bacterium]
MRLPASRALAALIVCSFLGSAAHAQRRRDNDPDEQKQEKVRDTTPGRGLLNIGPNHTGLSIGNSARWTGLRINFRDRGVQQLNGVNLSLWKAAGETNRQARLHGLNVGIVGPEGGYLRGINLGLGAVAEHEISGINLGIFGMVSQGNAYGLNVGGLGLVTEGKMVGLNVGGLGAVTEGDMQGINIGGLGAVAQGDVLGLNVGGLAIVSQGDVRYLTVGGLAVVGQGKMEGLTVSGLALVTENNVTGINLTGLALVGGEDITGLSVAGLALVADRRVAGLGATIGRIYADEVRGVTVAGWLKTWDQRGLSISPYTQIKGAQRGLAIGIFNTADELHGLQIGVLNRAKNNQGIAQWLPLVNFHK